MGLSEIEGEDMHSQSARVNQHGKTYNDHGKHMIVCSTADVDEAVRRRSNLRSSYERASSTTQLCSTAFSVRLE